MREITRIYIHCSYSLWGNFEAINSWHKERRFTEVQCPIRKEPIYIGYHSLILNSFTCSKSINDELFRSFTDGQVIIGRPVSIKGCHIKGDNEHSIGICYVGVSPTVMQVHSMLFLCKDLMREYHVPISGILGHYEYYLAHGQKPFKSCPNFYMDTFRTALEEIV